MKRCSKCREWKEESEFSKDNHRKNGLTCQCKTCRHAYNKEYGELNPQKVKETQRKYRENNRGKRKQYNIINKEKISIRQKEYSQLNSEKIKKYKEEYNKTNKEAIKLRMQAYYQANIEHEKIQRKIYYQANKQKKNEKRKLRRYSDDKLMLNEKISRNIHHSLRSGKCGRHWEDLVNYTVYDLRKRLFKTVPDGYIWDDFINSKLHIHHKIPISLWEFESYNDREFKQCWALCNLELLEASENIRRGAKCV